MTGEPAETAPAQNRTTAIGPAKTWKKEGTREGRKTLQTRSSLPRRSNRARKTMATENLDSDWHDLLFGVRRSVRYHMRRQQFFERWHTFTSATSVIFGSATVAFVLSKMGAIWVAGAAMVVTAFSAVDLVVGTSRTARIHNDLARRFITLEQSMIAAGNPTDKLVRRFTGERLSIEADEPPILRVLDSLCYNELARAMGYPPELNAKVGPLQRLWAQFFDWRPHTLKQPTP